MKLATLCYVRYNGRTLMLLRNKKTGDIHLGKWNGLGGKLAPGETPEECVIREVKEESGLTIYEPSLRGVLTFPQFDKDEDWYVFVFVADRFSGTLISCDEGQLEWIENSKLFELNLWAGDYYFLSALTEGSFFSGKFVYKNKLLIDHELVIHHTSY